jgi:hypothetical protein
LSDAKADPNRLPGINPDQIRLLSGVLEANQQDDIFQTLRTAQACMEVHAATIASCDDVYVSDQVAELYRRPMQETAERAHPGKGFAELTRLANLPDVGELALQNKETLSDIFKLRNSTAGIQFRAWFHEKCRSDPENVTKEYISLVSEVPFIDSFKGRSIRFLAQAAVGVAGLWLNPAAGLVAGTTASVVDSYVIGSLFNNSSAKVFLERLRELPKNSK